VTREARLRPSGPYSLLLTARRAGDATRRFRDGVLTATLETGDGVERAQAWQRLDGTVCLRADSDEAIEQLRFCLALDDDHSEFLRRFRRDPLLRLAIPMLAGLRQVRLPTVAHALLRAFCGQLIESHVARKLEWRIVAACSPEHEDLRAPATARRLGRLSPAELRKLGLHARRAAGLVRLCRGLDLERLRAFPTDAVAERLGRERGIGPWSVGLVCLEGLGRYERGLVGDLGLAKLASALRGRYVEPAETAELLEPYGEWAGLATVYLMSAFARGLIPLPEGAQIRRPPERIRNRAA
jgi:AraC family transcriptional regulator, regulatory protein of adaptative response / DNA-3-methyladenine glycosylase II